jgi:type I restriction enzyme M protein
MVGVNSVQPVDKIQEGVKKGYFRLLNDNTRIEYLSQSHKEQFNDPEEHVRAEYYFDLIEKYRYSGRRISFEVEMPDRTPERFADIVIYVDDARTRPYIVVECKKDGISNAEFEQATKQTIANARVLKAPYAICVAGNTQRAMETDAWNDKEPEKATITDIPISYGKIEAFRYKKGDANWDIKVVDQDELKRAFQKCHDTLWAGGKRSPTTAFDEFAKIIFVKIRDEKKGRRIGEPYDFQIKTHESAESVYQRTNAIYLEAKAVDPEVFKDRLQVEPEELYTVVEHLQGISLDKTDLDTKGVAFEHFMEDFFKGKSGQFFTPRLIVNFAIAMMDIGNEDLVLDPACGSGGFLLHALDAIRRQAEEFYPDDLNAQYRYWHDFAKSNLFGIEINDSIARVAKMNMIIHDDGHTNVIGFDALENIEKMNEKNPGFGKNRFDVIVTNPPFGASVKSSEHPYLAGFTLGKNGGKVRNNQSTEILFIERCMDFLKPGTGQMAIVLPDGILTNSSQQYVRDFLMEKAQLLAVVSLPPFAFSHFGAGVKSSLVFVRKKGLTENLGRYRIFMAIAEYIGYDATGRKVNQNDLPKIIKEYKKFLSSPEQYN